MAGKGKAQARLGEALVYAAAGLADLGISRVRELSRRSDLGDQAREGCRELVARGELSLNRLRHLANAPEPYLETLARRAADQADRDHA
ncbi:hypothetical protein [Actinoallomurus sp. NPDC050550]|uniref:hypothetical protein n=1 Tax=Actinoallomurus sp. NPDC050550 TaxID=3154937 RepID=UPI0033E1EFAA